MQRILIWDIPTRLFHWTLALSFLGTWLTTESDQWLSVHVFLGYLMMALVGFRLVWGLVGSHYARFGSFWFGPRDAFAYLKKVFAGTAERHIGHEHDASQVEYVSLDLLQIRTQCVSASRTTPRSSRSQRPCTSASTSRG